MMGDELDKTEARDCSEKHSLDFQEGEYCY